MFPDRSVRRGAILVIVAGLASILLALCVTFMLRMRTDGESMRIVVADGQARLMYHAALMYIQEGARLGWGDDETFGWTDVRDGSLGPKGPRVGGAPLPAPTWWNYPISYIPKPQDSDLPPAHLRRWPCPGSVIRAPMGVPVLPPYAIQMNLHANPVFPPSTAPAYGTPGWETAWTGSSENWPRAWANEIFSPAAGAVGMLDPQPVADFWRDPLYLANPTSRRPDFISGAVEPGASGSDWPHHVGDGTGPAVIRQLQVRPGTENLAWFRIYRETLADHDNDGVPAYDHVALYSDATPDLKNWNVFVIAAGCGPTRGYRFWDLELNDPRRALEPVTAKESGLFADEQLFNDLLEQTVILWYRVEWSAMQGGGFSPGMYRWGGWNGRDVDPWHHILKQYEVQYADVTMHGEGGAGLSLRGSSERSQGGNFPWIQRLDHEPENW